MTTTATNRPEAPPTSPLLAIYRVLCRAALLQVVAGAGGALLGLPRLLTIALLAATSLWMVRRVRSLLPPAKASR